MLKIGDKVRVLEPFNASFPDIYDVVYVKENGVCGILDDRDFDPKFLEVVQ